MTTRQAAARADNRWQVNRTAVALLLGAWAMAATLMMLMGDPLGARFLDLPLGVYLAGQGAVIALVIVGFSIAGRAEGEGR
jgi:putative solute:sodium symporter small subunit